MDACPVEAIGSDGGVICEISLASSGQDIRLHRHEKLGGRIPTTAEDRLAADDNDVTNIRIPRRRADNVLKLSPSFL